MLCSRKVPAANKIMEEGWGGGGGFIMFPVESFFVLKCQKNSLGNNSRLCFRKFPVAKKITDEGGYQDFCQNFFLSQSAKKFRRGTLLCCVSENSGSEKPME